MALNGPDRDERARSPGRPIGSWNLNLPSGQQPGRETPRQRSTDHPLPITGIDRLTDKKGHRQITWNKEIPAHG